MCRHADQQIWVPERQNTAQIMIQRQIADTSWIRNEPDMQARLLPVADTMLIMFYLESTLREAGSDRLYRWAISIHLLRWEPGGRPIAGTARCLGMNVH